MLLNEQVSIKEKYELRISFTRTKRKERRKGIATAPYFTRIWPFIDCGLQPKGI